MTTMVLPLADKEISLLRYALSAGSLGPSDAVDAVARLIATIDLIWGEKIAIPMLLWCPECAIRHIDKGEFATKEKVHHTHACQSCGHVWRPALVPTVGVQFLPGFKDPE